MGLLGTMSAVGTASGAALGGILMAALDWRAIFLINTPLAAVGAYLCYRHLPADRQALKLSVFKYFDGKGTCALALTLAAYALAVTLGRGSFSTINAVLLAMAIGLAMLFVAIESKVDFPLIRLALFRNPVLRDSFVMSALVTTVLMANLVVGPFYLTAVHNLDPVKIGIVMSSGPLVAMLTGVPAGRLVDRFGAARMTALGLCGIELGTLVVALAPLSLGVAGYVAAIAVLTAGYALFQAANNTAVMSQAPADQRGVISSLVNLARNIGLITGASVMAALFAFGTHGTRFAENRLESIGYGMEMTFWVANTLIAIALVIAFRGVRRPLVPA